MSISTLPLFPELEVVGPPPELTARHTASRKRRASGAADLKIMLEPLLARQVLEPEVTHKSSEQALKGVLRPEKLVVAAQALEPVVAAPAPLPRPKPLTNRHDVMLADVMNFVSDDQSITATQRSDRLCAMRRLAGLLNGDPRLVSAAPDVLR